MMFRFINQGNINLFVFKVRQLVSKFNVLSLLIEDIRKCGVVYLCISVFHQFTDHLPLFKDNFAILHILKLFFIYFLFMTFDMLILGCTICMDHFNNCSIQNVICFYYNLFISIVKIFRSAICILA